MHVYLYILKCDCEKKKTVFITILIINLPRWKEMVLVFQNLEHYHWICFGNEDFAHIHLFVIASAFVHREAYFNGSSNLKVCLYLVLIAKLYAVLGKYYTVLIMCSIFLNTIWGSRKTTLLEFLNFTKPNFFQNMWKHGHIHSTKVRDVSTWYYEFIISRRNKKMFPKILTIFACVCVGQS